MTEILASQLNLFISNFFKNDKMENWRNQQLKKNNIQDYLKKNKNNIISIVNKLAYIDKDNYKDMSLYNEDKKKQKDLKNQIKKILNNDKDNLENNLNDLILHPKQHLLFKYTKDNKKVIKFGTKTEYEYMLEKYIYTDTNKQHLISIYKKIENSFMSYEYVLLNNRLNLSKYTQIFVPDDLFNDIVSDKLSTNEYNNAMEILLDIKQKLFNKVSIYLLHVNIMIKHKIISYEDIIGLIIDIKNKTIDALNTSTINIIYSENASLWCFYFIFNYILYKNVKSFNFIFSKEILYQVYSKYKYLEYL